MSNPSPPPRTRDDVPAPAAAPTARPIGRRPSGEPYQPSRRAVRVDLIAVGLLLTAVGVGWFLERFGVSAPWRLAAPVALIVVGCLLALTVLLSADGGRRSGRSGLAWLGAGLLIVSVVLGVDAARYAAPIGNLTATPSGADWPVSVERSAGNIDIDLTRHSLPEAGRMSVRLGAGNVRLVVNQDAPVRIDTRVTTGQINVDGRRVASGLDVRWSNQRLDSMIVIAIDVAAGQVDIHHA